jgi:GNAT superfamily N-acetyltransferase
MLYELEKAEYKKVLPVFRELSYTLGDDAIIEGNRAGRIYVDDVTNPKTAFVWGEPSEFYLAGDFNNDKFNLSLQKVITEEITPEVMKSSFRFCVLHYSPSGWDRKIKSLVQNQTLRKTFRWWLIFKSLKVDRTTLANYDFHIEPIDNNLLKKECLVNMNKVVDYVTFKWHSIEDFVRRGFGFCLLHRHTIVSWCISSNNVGKKCEITIGTDEKYRNKGFGTLVASALVRQCVSRDLIPSWHCGDDNLPSLAVAEKIGFEKALLYPVYTWLPETREYLFWLMKNNPKKIFSSAIRILLNSPY